MTIDDAPRHDAVYESRESTTPASPAARPSPRRRRVPDWARVFLVGLTLWVVTVPVTFLTGNVNLSRRSSCWAASWSL